MHFKRLNVISIFMTPKGGVYSNKGCPIYTHCNGPCKLLYDPYGSLTWQSVRIEVKTIRKLHMVNGTYSVHTNV